MNQEKTDQLFKKFDRMFPDRDDISKSCMFFGFECGDGWHDIILDMLEKLNDLDEEVHIRQIKEKFGTLRVYISGPEVAHGIVEKAELKSAKVCEMCGEKGSLRGKAWVYTMCDKCWDDWQKGVI